MSFKRAVAAVLAASSVLSVIALAPVAHAGTNFGPMIDEAGGYDGQRKCDPDAEPGVLAFRRIVLKRFPWGGPGGIGRACSIGGQSEHKEGRAWDWMVNVGVDRDRRAAEAIIDWLEAPDRYGNEAAMARRLGIMYLIWNRRSWSPSWGWSTYCVQRKRGCVDPDDGHVKSPHTDHVHFSFTWAGARKQTTYWNRKRSLVASAAAVRHQDGLWQVGRNGDVRSVRDAYDMGGASLSATRTAVDIAARPDGWGYWILTKNGRLDGFGGAEDLGGGKGAFAALAPTPDGSGYWLLRTDGSVAARGSASNLGGVDAEAVEIAPTVTGAGYWIMTKGGRVVPFGDAASYGDLRGSRNVVDLLPSPTGSGYLIATRDGRVRSFGDAVHTGDLGGDAPRPIVALVPDGDGYALVNDKGGVKRF